MIKAVFTYSLLTIAFILVSLIFLSAINLTQLGVGILIYLLFALFVYKAFPHFWGTHSKKPDVPSSSSNEQAEKTEEKVVIEKTASVGISDIDKRAFLKLIGASGILFFLISIFGRRVESLLFGQNPTQAQENLTADKTSSTPASSRDEYRISGIDNEAGGYFGYIKEDGGWYIMKGDPSTRSFLYVKGNSKFPENWENRENLKYDYYNNIFKP